MATRKQKARLKNNRQRTSSTTYDAIKYPRRTTTMQFQIPIYVPDRTFTPQPPPRIVPPRTQSPKNLYVLNKPDEVPPQTQSQKNLYVFKKPDEVSSSIRHNRLETSSRDPTIHKARYRIPTRFPSSSSTPSTSSVFVSIPQHAPNFHSSPPSSSSATEFSEIKASIHNLQIISSSAAVAKCPLCSEPVDRDSLQQFEDDNDGGITMRQQMKFCHLHKTQSAKAEWNSKGYPQIDWASFDWRLAWFNDALDEILKRRRPSYYRRELEQQIKNGNRSLVQSMKNGAKMLGLEVGYYGPKGAMMMNKHIITEFAPTLRLLAAHDPLIHSSSVSTFVPAVLTPELATLLVIQDFCGKINEEQARAILKESAELGNLLHDEEGETDGNSGKTVAKRYKPSSPQFFRDQPRPAVGLKQGHRSPPGRNKIKIMGANKLMGNGSRRIISEEETDELA